MRISDWSSDVCSSDLVKSRVAVAFIGRERRRLQIGNLLCKNPRVACGFHIMRNRIREPDEIVRTPGPHAPVKGWMPPVEDVAFLELMGGRGQDMAPRCRWIDVQLREDILELISEAECSACLVEAGAGAHAGADRLVG